MWDWLNSIETDLIENGWNWTNHVMELSCTLSAKEWRKFGKVYIRKTTTEQIIWTWEVSEVQTVIENNKSKIFTSPSDIERQAFISDNIYWNNILDREAFIGSNIKAMP
jgi:hypothetical protein